MRRILGLFLILCSILTTVGLFGYENQAKRDVATAYSEKWCNDKDKQGKNDGYGNIGPDAIGYNVWYDEDYESVYYNDYGHDPYYDSEYNVTRPGGKGDCANFVSQCLIAGGLGDELSDYLNKCWSEDDRVNWAGREFGPGYTHTGQIHYKNPGELMEYGVSGGGKFKTIANVSQAKVRDFLRDYYHAQYFKGSVPFNKMAAGDVVIFIGSGDHHTTFVGAVTPTKDDLLLNYHTSDRWHRSLVTYFTNAATYNAFHLEPTVPRVEKIKIEELNPDNSVYRVIYQADRSVGGYPVLIDEPASGSRNIKITLEFNESIQFVRYKDTNNQLGEKVKPPSNPH